MTEDSSKTLVAATAAQSVQFVATVKLAYPVHFTRNLFGAGNGLLESVMRAGPEALPQRGLCFVDGGLNSAQPDLVARVVAYFEARPGILKLLHDPVVFPGGEAAKESFEIPHKVLRLARQVRLSRQAYVLAIGGGAFLDAVGFAASLIHRGVRLLRMPSTVLAQNDSGVGVKNGLNLGGVKNFLGTFAAPVAVLNDFALLETLSDRDWIAGTAEAFKVALIKDARFLEWLLANTSHVRARTAGVMEHLIHQCAVLHLCHIQAAGDPFEQGAARPLDFGHWAAHKIESLSEHELRHGEAVGIGIAIDLLYAVRLGFIPASAVRRVVRGLRAVGLPLWHETLDMRDPGGRLFVLNGVEEFREHLGGTLHITLPRPLGQKIEVNEIDAVAMTAAVADLRRLAHAQVPAHQRSLRGVTSPAARGRSREGPPRPSPHPTGEGPTAPFPA